MPESKAPNCAWVPDEDGTYYTDCGAAFTIIDGKPSDNGMKFCCYCGKPIDQQAYVPPTDAEEDDECMRVARWGMPA